MLRNDIRFSYGGAVLATACRERKDHHDARLEYWRAELESAKAAYREAGIQIREHQVTGGTRLSGVIDTEREQWMNKCQEKVRAHESRAGEYGRWLRGFEVNSGMFFDLDPDDIAFFGL